MLRARKFQRDRRDKRAHGETAAPQSRTLPRHASQRRAAHRPWEETLPRNTKNWRVVDEQRTGQDARQTRISHLSPVVLFSVFESFQNPSLPALLPYQPTESRKYHFTPPAAPTAPKSHRPCQDPLCLPAHPKMALANNTAPCSAINTCKILCTRA